MIEPDLFGDDLHQLISFPRDLINRENVSVLFFRIAGAAVRNAIGAKRFESGYRGLPEFKLINPV